MNNPLTTQQTSYDRRSAKLKKELSERLFDAAQVPDSVRQEYWEWYNRMTEVLRP